MSNASRRRSSGSDSGDRSTSWYLSRVALGGVEAGALLATTIATVTTWIVGIQLKWNFKAMGVTLTGASLTILKSMDKYLYPAEVDTPTYAGRCLVAATLCLVSLHSCGFGILSTGPKEPISMDKRKSDTWLAWILSIFKKKENMKVSSPMYQCFFGILAILSFMRTLEYLIILMSRQNFVQIPSSVKNMLGLGGDGSQGSDNDGN